MRDSSANRCLARLSSANRCLARLSFTFTFTFIRLSFMRSKHQSPQPEQLAEAPPTEDPPMCAMLILSTAIDQEPCIDLVSRQS